MNEESMWRAVHRMEAAADKMRQDTNRMEEAVHRFAVLLEDGYGGNGLRLIELLENQNVNAQDPAKQG